MRAIRINPDERHEDVLEFVFELENGLARGAVTSTARISLYERNPLRFWQVTSWVLLLLLIASLAVR